MEVLIPFAFLAGLITVLSPCVLPVLPVILAGSAHTGRLRPLGTIIGFIGSFSLLTLSLSWLVRTLGLDPELLRWLAGGVIGIMGLVLIVPRLKTWFMRATQGLLGSKPRAAPVGKASGFGKQAAQATTVEEAKTSQGFWPGIAAGLSLGAVWTPCVGPIMASVITLAATQRVDSQAVLITLVYSLGTALPLFVVMQGGRSLLKRFQWLMTRLEGLQGKVVLVDFWTYSCVNCLRTLPTLRNWHDTYAESGLVIVGVHSPEFAFEAKASNLEATIQNHGVTWPVVQDNDFGIWNSFSNR